MLNELEYFTPKLEGWRQYVFTGAATLIAIVAFIVQRAVYRTVKRLGYRHINQIIIPSLVSKLFIIYCFFFVRFSQKLALRLASPKAGPRRLAPEGWPPKAGPRRLAPEG